MELGVVGLGRMGRIVVDRCLDAGHDVVAFDIDATAREDAADAGATPADTLDALAAELGAEKRIWLMVPAGDPLTPPSTNSRRTSIPTTSSWTAGTATSRTRRAAPRNTTSRTSTVVLRAAPPARNSGSP